MIDRIFGSATICPTAPTGAQTPLLHIAQYVTWGVLAIFVLAVVVAVGAIVAGRMFGLQHASKVGMVSAVVVVVSAIAYVSLPGILTSILGGGCIG
ncbi:MAG: hypothetical protein LBR32_00695 [Propionibacteriaceae bacterium]|jgi:hypothetical protein|nr:hypothetical protein [Propionibacteriaceae bacterium]